MLIAKELTVFMTPTQILSAFFAARAEIKAC